ncbi:hypothetical protein WG899_09995 [Paucibacter sp. AS339]|uniref:hypothetical protein n=1 Tax=Paucibacter hankyongi TaxID=3133434 RepID=UPI0030B2AA39
MKLHLKLLSAALALSPMLGLAQTANPPTTTAPPPAQAASAAAAEAPTELPLAGMPSAAVSAPEGTEAVAPPPSCATLTQRAMSTDLRAATAMTQNKPVDELAKLFDRAIAQWTLALDACEGRARDRAQKNLSDVEKQRGLIAERQAAGSQCEVSHRDAAALQDLAKQAFGERRWPDAASLYGKAETMWDLAAEHCTGSQQQIATKRREQAETDAHNAEFCAPLFDRAREFTQKFRSASSGLSVTERQQQSQMAETLWRKTSTMCKGAALELAGNNAQALARERGTPWVATAAPEAAAPAAPALAAKPGTAPAPVSAAAAGAAALALVTGRGTAATAAAAAATGTATAPAAGSVASAKPAASPTPTAPTPAPTSAPSVAPPAVPTPAAINKPAGAVQDLDVRAGDTHYKGQFVREEGQVVSGTGRVEWANGDVYIGALVRSARHGKGEFIWANGQRYEGDWVQNKATGQGKLQFTNGNRYEGSVIDGSPEGEGQLNYASGDVYKGQISQGIPHGKGSYRWQNGQQFDGDWVQDKPHGKGILRYANGNRYEGMVSAGQPHGEGKMQMSSGDRYEGNFHQGKPHGQGSYQWKSGERYVGAWVGGLKHGQGVFHWPSGDRWEGEFKADERTDDGVIIRKD